MLIEAAEDGRWIIL